MEQTPQNNASLNQPTAAIWFKISGALNDEATLPLLTAQKFSMIRIDWSELKYICSAGLVLWLGWLESLRVAQPQAQIEFYNCPAAVIRIMNTVPEFLPENGRVASVQADCAEALAQSSTCSLTEPTEMPDRSWL